MLGGLEGFDGVLGAFLFSLLCTSFIYNLVRKSLEGYLIMLDFVYNINTRMDSVFVHPLRGGKWFLRGSLGGYGFLKTQWCFSD